MTHKMEGGGDVVTRKNVYERGSNFKEGGYGCKNVSNSVLDT